MCDKTETNLKQKSHENRMRLRTQFRFSFYHRATRGRRLKTERVYVIDSATGARDAGTVLAII